MSAIFVVGPESTGTKLVTRLLIAGGAIGDGGDVQRFDTRACPGNQLCVYRRSLPHGGLWPNLDGIADRLIRETGGLQIVVTTREMYATTKSAVNHNHVANQRQARTNYLKALAMAMAFVTRREESVFVVTYEALVLHPGAMTHALMQWAKLRTDKVVDIYDGNIKHYNWKGELQS